MPEPITTLYVQPIAGLRLRTKPNGTVLKVISQNTEVMGLGTQQIGNILWQQVTHRTEQWAGWMGAREGSEIYLAPTRVGAPPIPTGETPYDGKTALWVYHPDAANFNALIDSLPLVATALFVKTSDGVDWQGVNDDHLVLGINDVDDVDRWVDALGEHGIEFHAWAVLNGVVSIEAQRIIEVCNRPGVRSMVLDIEPHHLFWSGPRENIRIIMERVRANIPAGFHIGLSVDPRLAHYAAIFPDEWKPFVDSVHPQCYWETFHRQPVEVLRSAYAVWSGFGKPIIPVLQGDAPPDEIVLARDTAKNVHKAQGISVWRLGVMDEDQLAAIGDVVAPPIPEPIETLQTTDRINVRSKPSIAGSVRRVLEKGAKVRVQGHYSGTGAKDWGKLPDEPVASYAARDFMREPVIVVPPKPKVDMFVWATPYLNIRKEPDAQAQDVGDLEYGIQVAVEDIGVMNDGWRWGKIGPDKFVAIEADDGDPKLLRFERPPVIEAPSLGEWSLGIHKHEGAQEGTDGNVTNSWLLRMADEGLLTGIHIINDFGFANAMANRGVRVLFRMQFGVNDNIGQIAGDRSDIELGKSLWRGNANQHAHANLHPAIEVQPHGTCEANLGKDGHLFLGYAMAADDQGRKIGAYTNSFGTPANLNMLNGKFVANDVWKDRIDSGCQAYLMAHGHRAIYNGYGRARNLINPANGQVVGFKETDDPACALWSDGARDDLAFRWYCGQWHYIWEEIMPADCRPFVDLGECGSSAARIATLGGRKSPDDKFDLPGPGGLAALVWDLGGLQQRFLRSPWIKEKYYWTDGGDGGGPRPKGLYGFAYSSLDSLNEGVYWWAKAERVKYARRRAA